jgi:Xaa-Pro aminopeptidase
MNHAARIARLRGLLEEPLLVTDPVNVRYLTGFVSSNSALLVEEDRVRLFTDFRYAQAAREVACVEFAEAGRNLIDDLANRLSGRIGFESTHLCYAEYETLAAGGLELVPRRYLVERLRAVKDEDEIALIRRATEITDEAFNRLARERFVGRTERELAWAFASILHELGADGPAFETIVASGPNSSRPHGRATDKVIERGETIVIDAAASLGGYSSDCTRTWAAGEWDAELREAYEVVLEAQARGVEAVRAGRSGRDVDAEPRGLIDGTRFKGTFGHGLGHGIGLLVHEAPTLRPESESTLEPGNVVTVEPGIYLEGRGGIRIEDLVVVREDDAEDLTGLTKELLVVG